MILFLATFFIIYGGVHLYVYHGVKHGLGFEAPLSFLLAFFMVAMVVAPMLVRLAERRGMEELARVLAYVGYVWMGLLFLYFSASLAIDVYHAVLFAGAKLTGTSFESLLPSATTRFSVSLGWACIVSLYGAWEARTITTERVVITTDKLPPGCDTFTVAQISDVHLGLIVRQQRVSRIMQAVRQSNPDVVVSTGDLVDGQLDGLSGLARMLSEIRPRYGKFAVTGNHEFYAGLEPSLAITREAGFQVLRGESVTVADSIVLAGVDDPAASQGEASDSSHEHALLASLRRDRFTVLLKHRPQINRDSLGLFDLQLSGHVHKGQIFPFNLVTYLFYPVKTGYSSYPRGSSLYVSRGSGTWALPSGFSHLLK